MFATLANGQIAEGSSEGVTLPETLERILQISPVGVRDTPSIGELHYGKHLRTI